MMKVFIACFVCAVFSSFVFAEDMVSTGCDACESGKSVYDLAGKAGVAEALANALAEDMMRVGFDVESATTVYNLAREAGGSKGRAWGQLTIGETENSTPFLLENENIRGSLE